MFFFVCLFVCLFFSQCSVCKKMTMLMIFQSLDVVGCVVGWTRGNSAGKVVHCALANGKTTEKS